MFQAREAAARIANPVLRAAFVAKIAHDGQKRRGTGEDYISHPARVASAVTLYDPADETAVCAAWLHDVIEDTPVTREDIEELFGEAVAAVVDALTNDGPREDQTREDRKALDRERLRGAPEKVKIIKMLDRLDNIRDCGRLKPSFIQKYCRESRLLGEVLAEADAQLAEDLFKAIDEREARVGESL